MTTRLLHLLHAAGVSVAIFSVFTCTRLASGVSYLDADARIVCWDATHRRYVGGAIVWLLIVPVGVPAFFTWLLRRFKVPHMARLLEANAWLRAAVALAWREGLAQPPRAARLGVDTVPTRHLEALYAFFLRGRSAEEASDILLGSAPPVADSDERGGDGDKAAAAGGTPLARVSERLRRMSESLTAGGRLSAAQQAAAAVPLYAAARREFLLEALLQWCKTSDAVSIPTIVWLPDDQDDDDTDDAGADAPSADAAEEECAAAAVTAPPLVRTRDVPRLLEVALRECGCVRACACSPVRVLRHAHVC